jgi:hypothetical protein
MTTSTPQLDEDRVERFAGTLLTTFTAGMTTLMVDLADRTGLLAALAAGPGSSAELAARAGLTERYVRECLGALATAGLIDYDAGTAAFTLPAEHAACLTGPGALNLAPVARIGTLLAGHVAGVARAFRVGGGVPYEAYRPEFTAVMDVKAASRLEDNLGNPVAPWLYAVSTLHCLTVSLAYGGAGLGTAWGEELARARLADAGFGTVTVHDVPEDPLDSLYVARPGRQAGS